MVLARELSLREIQAVAEAAPDLDLEVFVHGALCYSYSGQCLFRRWNTARAQTAGGAFIRAGRNLQWRKKTITEERGRTGTGWPGTAMRGEQGSTGWPEVAAA